MGVFIKNNLEFESKEEITFVGDNKENDLESILFKNPLIFPVKSIADAESWIPLARQLSIRNHGKLDILATDSMGNLYVVECKIKGNNDMKTIRGQITDYVAGLWAGKDDWDDFQKNVEKSLGGKNLEEILNKSIGDDSHEVFVDLKQNFEYGKYFLVFAVNRISPGMREAINWHNKELDTNNKYPCFAIEIKKYLGDNSSEFIVTQNFPFDLNELKRKIDKNEKRVINTRDDWFKEFNKNEFSDAQRKDILDFVKTLDELIKKDGGSINYGTGSMPRILPKFNYTSTRSAIGLKANGKLMLQFGLMEEYPEEEKQFRYEISKIDDLQKIVSTIKSKSEAAISLDQWLPHKDEILSILKNVLLHL